MPTWKYLIEELSFQGDSEGSLSDDIMASQEQLNEAGDGGWEAIAVWPAPAPNPSGKVYVLFKQPK
jgi:hypothetical protein